MERRGLLPASETLGVSGHASKREENDRATGWYKLTQNMLPDCSQDWHTEVNEE